MTLPTDTPVRAEDHRPRPGRRPSAALVAAVLAVLLGVAGLVVGARQGRDAAPAGAPPAGGVTVSESYLRVPASPEVAAVYLTIRNGSGQDDVLLSAYAGAARRTSVHATMGAMVPGDDTSEPVTVPAGGTVRLSPGKGHIMLDGLTGPLRAGDRVSLLLSFRTAGQLLVEAPVIAIGAPAPGGAPS